MARRGEVLTWVPTQRLADELADADGVSVEVVVPGGGPLPPSAGSVEFYVPPFFPTAESIAAIAALPALRVVQTMTAGVDRLLPHMRPGVLLCNARGVHDASTAEWVVAAMLAAIRDMPRFAAEHAARRWSYAPTDSLAGKTVLIIGYGSIGAAVERRLAGFEVEVLRVARTARPGVSPVMDLPELLPSADVVVLLAPVTPETVGMIDAGVLGRMRNGALLVNAARGSLVVTDALRAELESGRLRAVLDVTDPEPLPPDHPLWSAPGLLITPHVAASTPYSARAAAAFVRAQVLRYRDRRPLVNVISGPY
jgi:phosphoglycerate dehydrogenase-like enzyme